MQKYSDKSKHGFTLVELVLVMGITLIFVAIIFAVFSIVNTSHARVAVLNDAKDFAALNMQAIENLTSDASEVELLASPVSQADCISVYFTKDGATKESILYYLDDSGAAVRAFDYGQYTIKGGAEKKWSILTTQPIFTTTATTGIIRVKLQVVDNASGTVYYTLTKDMIFLNILTANAVTNPSGIVIKVKNYAP